MAGETKKKGKTIIIHIPVMASGMIDHFFHVNKQQNGTIMMLWAAISIQGRWWACVLVKWGPTGILPSFISVDKAGDQHNECEESNGAHQPDKPALGRYSSVNAGQTWGEQYWVTLTSSGHLIECLHRRSLSDAKAAGSRARRWWKRSNINIKQLILLV